jgi:hypothetical protein
MTPAGRIGDQRSSAAAADVVAWCPFELRVERIDRFLNAEVADDPVYDGIELQWFDDDEHGTGMLVFLSRRADRKVDYYLAAGLELERTAYELGAGTGSWEETTFEVAHLDVGDDGVTAEVRFSDREGRAIELAVDDRGGRDRTRGALLAPVGSTIEHPTSLLLVHLQDFDLVRRGGRPPTLRIDGRAVTTGALPGRALHGRELIKYAAPVHAIVVNPTTRDEVTLSDRAPAGGARLQGRAVEALVAGEGAARTRLEFRPAVPDLRDLTDGETREGAWRVHPAAAPPLAGGRWRTRREGGVVVLSLVVTDGWRPGRLPPLMRTVTRVAPVFRRWPTTYRWAATITLGDRLRMRSAWRRTGDRTDDAYRRMTGSSA